MDIIDNKIAHRGVFNNTTIPENSLKAFQKALKMGYAIELDVQLTKDNVLVVFHDSNLKRMTGINLLLEDLTYDEIKEYRLLNTDEKIPTLKEVLALVNEKVLLDIEIKNTKRVKEVCSILMNELECYTNFILKSFSPLIVHYLKKYYPSLEVGYLMKNNYHSFFRNLFLKRNFLIRYTKADFLAIEKSLLFTKKFQRLKKKYPLFVWTIKKEDTISNEEYVLICNDLGNEKNTLD